MIYCVIPRELADELYDKMVDAADLFNGSDYRRTVGGIAKSLGPPRASIVPLSGVTGELIVTVAWDISWYQYRVTPESAQPVRLEDKEQPTTRDRRRAHPGTFPDTDPPEA